MSTALQRAKSVGRGTYEQLSEGEVTKFRMDLKNSIVTESNHKIVESGQSSILVVCSGYLVYTLTENQEEKNAVKNISKPSQCFATSKAFFDALFRENYVRLLPDDKVDGHEVWVIESTPKQMIGGQPVKTVHYILKDCGLRVKTTGHNVDGAQVQVSLLSDIKFDTGIKPDRFVFKAPSGVRIIDISQSR
jgi:outer membrane lipoprotein-sorting protein